MTENSPPAASTAYAEPEACGLSKIAIDRLGEEIARALEYTPGGELGEIINKLGGKLLYKDFGSSTRQMEFG